MNESDLNREHVIVEIEEKLSALRDFRDTMVRLAQTLDDQSSKSGYILLIDPKVSSSRLNSEFHATLRALRPDLAQRIHMVTLTNGIIQEGARNLPISIEELLEDYTPTTLPSSGSLPRPDMQSEVLRFILLQWFLGRGPLTSDAIVNEVGCNYRTVVRTVARLGNSVRRGSDRSIELQRFPYDLWNEITAMSKKARSTINYTDYSDQPRSMESLYNRIAGIKRGDVAFGGVLGVNAHFPMLDVLGTPRLDISLHAFGGNYVPLRLEEIDPGLRPTTDPGRPVRIALHHLRRKSPCFTEQPDGVLVADPVECLLDLLEAGLTPQASSFLAHLEKQEMVKHGQQQ